MKVMDVRVAVCAERFEEASRMLDVGEHEGDRAGRSVKRWHVRPAAPVRTPGRRVTLVFDPMLAPTRRLCPPRSRRPFATTYGWVSR